MHDCRRVANLFTDLTRQRSNLDNYKTSCPSNELGQTWTASLDMNHDSCYVMMLDRDEERLKKEGIGSLGMGMGMG